MPIGFARSEEKEETWIVNRAKPRSIVHGFVTLTTQYQFKLITS